MSAAQELDAPDQGKQFYFRKTTGGACQALQKFSISNRPILANMFMEDLSFNNRTDLSSLHAAVSAVKQEIGKIIVGQNKTIDLLLAAILADGHVLIEGVPGVAKTLTAKLLARTLDIHFNRIQFTPDLMPSDVLGTMVFHPKTTEFHYKRGPLFANIVLIDEINRAPAKTQSSLFEVMEERQITLDGQTYFMEKPFIVLATQNPIEQEGTYRLPEAQLDRFMFKIEVKYPDVEEELGILQGIHARKGHNDPFLLNPVLSAGQLLALKWQVQEVVAETNVLRYIAQIVHKTRNHPSLYLGASPRASVAILAASKAIAAMRGRDFVTPEDIKEVAPHVLHHRIILAPEKEMEGTSTKEVVHTILDQVEVPR
jgi:MoxR-like ATPase